MPNCTFLYHNHTRCEQPALVKKLDKENSIVDKVYDAKGNLKSLRCFHPVLEHGAFCFNHSKMMKGQILPVEWSQIPKRVLMTIIARREVWQEQFEKKKRLSHAEIG